MAKQDEKQQIARRKELNFISGSEDEDFPTKKKQDLEPNKGPKREQITKESNKNQMKIEDFLPKTRNCVIIK